MLSDSTLLSHQPVVMPTSTASNAVAATNGGLSNGDTGMSLLVPDLEEFSSSSCCGNQSCNSNNPSQLAPQPNPPPRQRTISQRQRPTNPGLMSAEHVRDHSLDWNISNVTNGPTQKRNLLSAQSAQDVLLAETYCSAINRSSI